MRSIGPILGLAGLVFMAGSLAMLLFLVLSGVRNATPLNKTYFLQAHTEGITGARQISQWTYFYVCGDGNVDCTSAKAAYPFGDAWDSNADNAPDTLIGDSGNGTSSKKIYYLWRFGWVFIMIALFFSSITFIASFLSCCGRLGASIAYYNSLMALLTHSVAAAITTYVYPSMTLSMHIANQSAPALPLSSPRTPSRMPAAMPLSASTASVSSGAPGPLSSSPPVSLVPAVAVMAAVVAVAASLAAAATSRAVASRKSTSKASSTQARCSRLSSRCHLVASPCRTL